MGWSKLRDKYVKPALGFAAGGPIGGLGAGMLGGGGSSGGVGSVLTDELLTGDVIGGITGQTAADASIEAANIAAQSQREQLEYLMAINKAPQQYREQALAELSSLTTPEGQQAFIEKTKASPLYKEIMGGLETGEEAVMRHTSQTGGLRSGNVQSALADYGSQLQNKALTQSYGQGIGQLEGLAGIRTGEQQIGQTMAGIGQTQAQGQIGAAQAQQAGMQNLMNMGTMGLGFLI